MSKVLRKLGHFSDWGRSE